MTELAALYPFLEPTPDRDPAAVLADVIRSTQEKVEEIGRLRTAVVEAEATRLAACATAMAERFAAGGRLFTFGNGGSATDAAALAALFVDPGPGHRPLPAAALTDDVATLTALANDVGFEVVFARHARGGRARRRHRVRPVHERQLGERRARPRGRPASAAC